MRSQWLKPYCHAWRCMAASRRLTPSIRERAFTQAVVDLQGYYLLSVKENQPTLYNDVQTYFNDPEACYEQTQTIDRRKGRLEVRQIRVTTSMNAYLDGWPGLAQVAQLKRSVTTADKHREEVVYLITNLPPLQASPHRLLHLIRGHWSIENGLHYVRDVTFQEDRSHIRTGHAPQILAALRESRDYPYSSTWIDADRCHTSDERKLEMRRGAHDNCRGR